MIFATATNATNATTTLNPTVTAAIITAAVAAIAAIAGIINIFLTIHRNKQDGIVKYRMEWIERVRNEFTVIFSWKPYTQDEKGVILPHSPDVLRNAINKISLFMNIQDEYDAEILRLAFEYLERIERMYGVGMVDHVGRVTSIPQNGHYNKIEVGYVPSVSTFYAAKGWNEAEEVRENLRKKVRIYLKVEWTRVNAESAINKKKFRFCWNRFGGFQADKAIKHYETLYIDDILPKNETNDGESNRNDDIENPTS